MTWRTQYCYDKKAGLTLTNDYKLIGGSHSHTSRHFPTVRGLLKYLRTQYPQWVWRSKLTHYYGTIVEIQMKMLSRYK
jgi:hypothetical protein